MTITGLIKWKSWGTFAIFIFVAIFGPVAEMIAIYFGAWHYANFNFINIPVWLFVLWGDAAAFIYQTALEFRKLGLGND